jgi:hypothetical protein
MEVTYLWPPLAERELSPQVGAVTVFLQQMTLVAVIIGTLARSCVKADHCQLGKYCRHGAERAAAEKWHVETYGTEYDVQGDHIGGDGVAGRCEYCASTPNPLETQVDADGNIYNDRNEDAYVGFNMSYVSEQCANPSNGYSFYGDEISAKNNFGADRVKMDALQLRWSAFRQEEWCNACYDEVTDEVFDYTNNDIFLDNVNAMLWSDWLAFTLCVALVALSIVGELKDIELCQKQLRDQRDKVIGWRKALVFLAYVRKWSFLPGLQLTVPALIVTEGGGALSTCLNTVAILFLVEFDNALYIFGLNEKWRSRAESAGRVELSDAEMTALGRSKWLHFGCIMVAVMAGLVLLSMGDGEGGGHGVGRIEYQLLVLLPFASFWVAGSVEATCFPTAEGKEAGGSGSGQPQLYGAYQFGASDRYFM